MTNEQRASEHLDRGLAILRLAQLPADVRQMAANEHFDEWSRLVDLPDPQRAEQEAYARVIRFFGYDPGKEPDWDDCVEVLKDVLETLQEGP